MVFFETKLFHLGNIVSSFPPFVKVRQRPETGRDYIPEKQENHQINPVTALHTGYGLSGGGGVWLRSKWGRPKSTYASTRSEEESIIRGRIIDYAFERKVEEYYRH
ncbi:hypothetical protein TNCV_637451 [Trichonephila clavipes]|nr:hypothetical protein TNCV_637451 [Trichonephila clavipes]